MHRDLKPSVVIPCGNALNGVREVVGRTPGVADEVVAVDNNGTDRTAEVAGRLARTLPPRRQAMRSDVN